MNLPLLGIRRKFAITTLLALLPLLFLGVALSVYLISDLLRQEHLRQEDAAFASIDNWLEFEPQMGESDVRFLATLPAIPEILRARGHQNVDPLSGVSLDSALQRLRCELSLFLVTKRVYDQVRFIDRSGLEVVRVNLAAGISTVTPPSRLQNKKDRYYFSKAAQLKPGEVYISPIDLSREGGKLEKPLKPMFRFAAPIYNQAGAFQGIIVLNKDAHRFFSQLMKAPVALPGWWFIANNQGYYLHHTKDQQRLWGGPEDLNTGAGVKKDFPEAYREILAGTSTSVTWQGRDFQVKSRRFNLWPGNSHFITIAHMTPRHSFADYFRKDTWMLIGLAVLAALLAGLLNWWNARRISRPILDLNHAVVQFSRGHWEARAPVTTQDEIANLCVNFNSMADRLARLTHNLEEVIQERTGELQVYRDHLEAMVAERTTEVRLANVSLQQEISERQRGEEQLEIERQRLFAVMDALPAFVALLAPDYSIPFANREFRRRFGEPEGKRCYEFLFGRQDPCEVCHTFQVFKTNAPEIWEWTGPDHHTYQIYNYLFADTDSSPLVLELGIDITHHKHAEMELFKTHRALQALSAVNQALIHAVEETALLDEVCRVIVEVGGYRLAWVGYALEDEGKRVLPVALAGYDDGYVDALRVTWDDQPSGQGPGGRAIRSRQPIVVRDTSSDPSFSPWVAEAVKRGYASTISLPLVSDNSILGELAIYASEKDSFDSQEVDLLEQLAENLAFGIAALKIRVQHRQSEAEMQKLSQAVAQASDWVVITDKEGNIEYVNDATADMSGYTREELIGQNPRIFKSGKHETPFYQDLWQTITTGQPFRATFINRKKDGEPFHLDMTISPLRDHAGNITQYLSTAKDITHQLRLEEHLNYLSYYDPLTGLPNRTLFMDRIRQSLAGSAHSGKPVGVIALDLDRFKFINETFGPAVGDEALQEVGQRLAGMVREGDTVARLGNDEYGIVLVDLRETDDAVLVLEKIRKGVSYPIRAGGQDLMLTFSMGIAIYPQDGDNALTLLQNADSALSKAKEQGGNTYQFFAAGMNVKAANFVLLGNQLLHALHHQEFILHYQPYYQISNARMVGAEALIRWQHPDRGLVPPAEFIPILEDTGLIREVGEWTLREACRHLREWKTQGHEVVPVSVNFSAVQFSWPALVEMVERVIGESGLDPHLFIAEITESALMHDVEYTRTVLNRFKALGMAVSIDDFGTGYSSLSYLKRFPIDNLKIDISFIQEVTTAPDTASIVQAIISMAHSLDLKTIAEGAETKEQVQILRLLRCDIIQGFYYSRPLPAWEFVKLFEARQTPSDSPALTVVPEIAS
jgi:diguanylate cyclase (GGDEF)-like protein/PAS domain S-box-containing protein